MKKCRFLILTILFSIFLCIPILAESPDDGHLVAISVFDSNGKTFHDVLLMDEGCYSVYFEDSDSYTVVSASSGKGTFYSSFDINNKPSYMSHFDLNNKFSLDGAYSASYDVWYTANSGMHFRGYTIQQEHFDLKFASKQEFFDALAKYDSFESFISDNKSNEDDSKLPMLHYKFSAKNVLSFPNVIDKKISIDWNFADLEPYASNPMNYAIEIIISAHFYPNSEGLRHCWDATKTSINENCLRYLSSARPLLEKPYSFIYLKEGTALYESTKHIFATDELQDGYYLYIRSYSKDGTKSSNYKVYKCTTGGVSGQMDITYDTDGNEQELDESDRDDNQDYSNEFDEDSSSSADEDPTGDSYDGNGGYSFDTLYGNLKSMVNMLQGVPELWVYVMSWLPEWFPIFIVTMMGLLIVIGVLKYIF